jgi:hypothetical protein
MTEISLATGPNREPFFNYNSREDGRHQFVGCVVDYGGGHGDGIEEIIADAGAWIAPEDLAVFEERLKRKLLLRRREKGGL